MKKNLSIILLLKNGHFWNQNFQKLHFFVLLYKTKNKKKIIFLPNNIFDLTPPIFSKCSHNKHESVNVLMQFMRNETKLKKFIEDWPKIGPAILFNR